MIFEGVSNQIRDPKSKDVFCCSVLLIACSLLGVARSLLRYLFVVRPQELFLYVLIRSLFLRTILASWSRSSCMYGTNVESLVIARILLDDFKASHRADGSWLCLAKKRLENGMSNLRLSCTQIEMKLVTKK